MTWKNYYYSISHKQKARDMNDLLKAVVGKGRAAAVILTPWLQD